MVGSPEASLPCLRPRNGPPVVIDPMAHIVWVGEGADGVLEEEHVPEEALVFAAWGPLEHVNR